ncbi:MAG: dihydrofolate reductase, partial [Ignavibacteriae bacterium]|nr:dihydrofolate reductase [Ignavibacteriota bacterium]
IGNKGKIPWYSKKELKHFKKTTSGYPIIMGRITFESLSIPLINRLNIVISQKKNLQYPFEEVLIFKSLRKAYNYLDKKKYKKVFICGGESIYKSSIKNADKMIISNMNIEVNGDTKFPKIKKKIWAIEKTIKHKDFKIEYYVRIKKSK